jgi:hypothetical protein
MFILVPLAPIALSFLFRTLKQGPVPGSVWWCDELPIFTLTLSAATFTRSRELAQNRTSSNTTAGKIAPWLQTLSAVWALLACVGLVVYYDDTYLHSHAEAELKLVINIQLVAAVCALVFGLALIYFDKQLARAQRARASKKAATAGAGKGEPVP